jgi:hypothetical protein
MKVGDKVIHAGHGIGTIVALNETKENRYMKEHPADAIRLASSFGLLGPLGNCFYDNVRYPFIVQFDDGYKDAYSESDLTLKEE